jgi:hypothetical protein
MRQSIMIITAIHAICHLIGFSNAFRPHKVKYNEMPISKPFGLAWLLAFVLFAFFIMMFYYRDTNWWVFGFIATIVSQILVARFWQEAKYGTIANIIIFVICFIGYNFPSLKRIF